MSRVVTNKLQSTKEKVGTTATDLGKAAVSGIDYSPGDVGISLLAVRRDALGMADFGVDGKYLPLTTESNGLLAWKRALLS